MWPYWLMFVIPAWAILMPGRLKPAQSWVPWAGVFLLFTMMMGLRHEVGGDWFAYLPHFLDVGFLTLGEVITGSDPGYFLVNWLVSHAGGSIYHVNLFCAMVMMWGTVVFCRAQPNPWLALLAAVPFMLVVVGMGYTRQAVALGFALLALTALGNGRVRKFVIWIAIGATFHKSAVLLLPIAALASSRHRLLTAALIAVTTALLYYLLLADATEALWTNYVEAQYQSEGGLIRVMMNVLPALLLFVYRKRLVPEPQERRLWLWIAAFALICLPLVPLASTAVDRVALYLIPIQLFVFARIPRLAQSTRSRTLLIVGAVAYYATVLFVWLNFATHAFAWLPYQFMPLW
jgi:hypothetical protein